MAEILDRILTGDLSDKNTGFLVQMPAGVIGRAVIERAAQACYGTLGHPDLRIIDPDKGTISVDEIREQKAFLLTSNSGKAMKTLIVVGADRMNKNAANAFLKSLEEPTAKTRIIMLTDRPWALPTTILSRCDKRRAQIDPQDLTVETQSYLEKQVEPDAIARALEMSSGNPKIAADIIVYDLSTWTSSIMGWLENPKGSIPKETWASKDAPELQTLFSVLTTAVSNACSPKTGDAWSFEKIEKALNTLMKMSQGISRPGIDHKTRLHAALYCVAHA